jgi:hypothetical protein
MAYDYANDQWWGNEYNRALQNGQQDYADSLRAKMDANPHPYDAQTAAQNAQQVGMIGAKTLDMGRGSTDTWANGNNGMEYNTVGQYRTPGAGAWNSMSGQHGYAVNPGQVQGSPIGGALTPTQTMPQYGGIGSLGGVDIASIMRQFIQQYQPQQQPGMQPHQSWSQPQQPWSQPQQSWSQPQQSWQQPQQYQPQQQAFNWGRGYGSGQSNYMSGPLSQMYRNGWGR